MLRKQLLDSSRGRIVTLLQREGSLTTENIHLGAVTDVDGDGGYVIRGVACPLAALTGESIRLSASRWKTLPEAGSITSQVKKAAAAPFTTDFRETPRV